MTFQMRLNQSQKQETQMFATPSATSLRPKIIVIGIISCAAAAMVPSQTLASGPQCTSPYVQVQQGATPLLPDPAGEFTIQSVSIGEPFAGCSNKTLTVVMKVNSMDPGNTGTAHAPPNGTWN